MIDYDYENRLVDRIAVNKAATARLNPRQRRILLRYHRYGETLEEVGRCEGVTRERIRGILSKSYKRLRVPFVELPKLSAVKLAQTTRDTPPPGFDKAEFLRHMRSLIELREQRAIWEQQQQALLARVAAEQAKREELARVANELGREQREFARERAELAKLIAGETAKNAPPPLTISLPLQYTVHPGHHVYNSPSYAPPLPTKDQLCATAHAALDYLLMASPQQYLGNPWLGKWCTSVVFTRDGGAVSEAVNSIVRELPANARLSAHPVEIPDGTLGANATTPYASLRVTTTPDGLKLRFDVTWD